MSARTLWLFAGALSLPLAALHPAPAAGRERDVEVRAYVNDQCVVADEPFYTPKVDGKNQRSIALLGVVIGKLTEVLLQHTLKAEARKLTASGQREDTQYAMTHAANLYVARLDPAPALVLNGAIGCMTIVAGSFRPETQDCTADYIPKTLTPESIPLPEEEWRTSRTDDSLRNQLRRANICTEGEPRAVFESRFEFSDDGTAYRLLNAGYRVDTLLTTKEQNAERHMFYTLDITQPGANETPEHLSTAWLDLGRVRAGQRSTAAAPDPVKPTPWLRVPALSAEARRIYEDRTRVHHDTYTQIESLQRAIVREQRLIENLNGRIRGAAPEMAAALSAERTKSEVRVQTLEAELETRKAEYADLPHEPLQLMPVSIQVGVTESRSEKRALLALAKIIDSNAVQVASAASGIITRSVEPDGAPATPEDGGAKNVVSKEAIQRALEEKPKTRAISVRGNTEARSMIDLNVPFELNSAELRPDAVAQLSELQAALQTSALAGYRFRITGHTDARGKAEYNRALSLRRAQAVQRFLIEHRIDPARLEIAGAGADQLLRPDAPEDAANRRVEIRNIGKS